MNITFGGKYAISHHTFGINLEAAVDGGVIVCSVSAEALQDIGPSNAHS